MTTSTAVSAQGTVIQIASAESPTDWVTIRNVSTISGLRGGSRSEIDVTDLTSDAKEYRLGLKDNGSLTLAVNYNADDAGHQRLEAALDEIDASPFKITDPVGNIFTFSGFVKKFDVNWAVDSVEKGNLEIRITGAVTVTP